MFQLADYLNKSAQSRVGCADQDIGLVHPANIEGVIIWGNHSPGMLPDITHSTIHGQSVIEFLDRSAKKSKQAMSVDQWTREIFIPRVQQRGKEIIDARGSSSAPSAAMACVDQMRDWALGSDGKWVSMAVIGKGASGSCSIDGTSLASSEEDEDDEDYGVDDVDNLCFSYPVVCDGDGHWRKVRGLKMDAFAKSMIQKNVTELKLERDMVKDLLK